MELEEAIRTYLLTQTALTNLVSTRILLNDVSSGFILPAVYYFKVSDVKNHVLEGQLSLENPVYQYSAAAATKSGAVAIRNILKTALNDYHGVLSGITIQHIKLLNEMSSKVDGTYFEDLEYEITKE